MAEQISRAWQIRRQNFSDELSFCRPVKTSVISVTGSHCELECAHCNGHYLKSMTPVEFWQKGIKPETKSVLISGGCDPNGRVPVLQYLPILNEIKKAGLRINLHTGLVKEEEIEQISKIADTVSFDVVGDNDTLREVYGLSKEVEDYFDAYRKLKKRVRVIPHICIGLRGGQISGEYKAIEMLRDLGADEVVFLIFRPTKGTPFGNRLPPTPDDVARVLCQARIELPEVPLSLGCMRPGGEYRKDLDRLALMCGINKIVQPAPEIKDIAVGLGLNIKPGEECCAL
ncbi:MAG: radical SAM protein [Thermincola sp.]|nr:radical SAM protein [Thermincola sp.]MDT3702489.1 radical SAM protein [Thermincola sp.]